jgi:hypothetical protein
MSGSSYQLSGHDSDLKKLVSHRVTIVGHVEGAGGSAMSGSESAPTGAAGAAGSSAGSSASIQKLRVTSVKDVASSCSGG